MGTIRFELRKEKKDQNSLSPIRLIYSIQGIRKYYNTGLKTYEQSWDDKEQQVVFYKMVVGKDGKETKVKGPLMEKEVKKLNDSLVDIKRDIEKIEVKFEANGNIYSAEMVLNELKDKEAPVTKKDASSKELFAFIDRYITDHSNTRVAGSLSVYRSLKSHLEAYEKKTGKKITFEKIDYAFFQGLQNYLVSLTKEVDGKKVKALNNITIAKQLSTLKTFLNYAKAQGIEVSNKYESFKIKRENDLEVIALTRTEFESVYNLDLTKKPALDAVRDVFCFSCVTGLRYSDLKQLRREHIKDKHIDLTAVKTSHKTIIPLNPYSIAILKKYAADARPLPVISNQKSNEHLETICKLAGINELVEIVRRHGAERVVTVYPKHELIRMHAGRKTFASLSLEAGMRAEYVMKIGGWKDYKSFKRYMNLSIDSTNDAMAAAWGGKVIKPKLKAV